MDLSLYWSHKNQIFCLLIQFIICICLSYICFAFLKTSMGGLNNF